MTTGRPALFLSIVALSICGYFIYNHARQPDYVLAGTAHPRYDITDLGAGVPHGINNRGQIVGMFPAGVIPHSKDRAYFHGCLWDNGRRTEMKTFGGWYSDAGIITDNGLILGSASIRGRDSHGLQRQHGCLWDGSRMTDLKFDPRFRGTGAIHVTKSGAVFAESPPLGMRKQLHLWYFPSGFGPGKRLDMGVIGGTNIRVRDINDSGIVVGSRDTGREEKSEIGTPFPIRRAFLWQKRRMTDMGDLGGNGSEAVAVNNAGQIIGTADLAKRPAYFHTRTHAFLWESGKMHDLGALVGGDFSYPNSINEKGQVVGFSNNPHTTTEPVLWERGKITAIVDLIPGNTKWTSLSEAASINDEGQIVGDGGIQGGQWTHGYLLTPR